MEYVEATRYYEAITAIEAQEILNKYSISIYPNLNKDGQRKAHKEMYKKAFPNMQKTISISEMENLLNGK